MKIGSRTISSASILVSLLVLLILVIVAFGYFSNWVRVATGPRLSNDALRDPQYAIGQYLNLRGIEFVKTSDFLSLLDKQSASSSVLYLPVPHSILPPDVVDTVLSWVNAGGTLLYLPSRPFDATGVRANDPILDQIDSQMQLRNTRQLRNRAAKIRPFFVGCTSDFDALTPISVGAESLLVDLNPYKTYRDSTEENLDSEKSILSVGVGVNGGRVHLIPSVIQWNNHLFLCHDNARLLYALMHPEDNRSTKSTLLWALPGDAEWLTDRLWRDYPVQVLLCLGLVVLWIRMVAVKHVRRFPAIETNVRSISEYVTSLSHFRWKAGQRFELISTRRQEVLKKLRLTDTDEAIEALNDRVELSNEELTDALSGPITRSKRRFTTLMKTLNKIRQKL